MYCRGLEASPKAYTLHGSKSMTFWKWQNHGDGKRLPGVGGTEGFSGSDATLLDTR